MLVLFMPGKLRSPSLTQGSEGQARGQGFNRPGGDHPFDGPAPRGPSAAALPDGPYQMRKKPEQSPEQSFHSCLGRTTEGKGPQKEVDTPGHRIGVGRQREPLGFGLSSGRSPQVAVRMFRDSPLSPSGAQPRAAPPMATPLAPQPHVPPGYCAGLLCPLAPHCSLSGTHVSCRPCPFSSATPASSQLPTSGPLHGCSMARSSSPDTHGTQLLTSFGILTFVTFSFLDRLSPMSLTPSLPHFLGSLRLRTVCF